MNQLQTMIKLTQLLHHSGCTYNEVDELLSSMKQHYKEVREQKEYDTFKDYFNNNKTNDIGNDIVDSLNDIDFTF